MPIGSPVSAFATDVDLFDAVMVLLGETLYSQMDNTYPAYNAANKLYAVKRDSELASHLWNGCVAWDVLSDTTRTPLVDWTKEYIYPADCLRVLMVNTDTTRYEIGWNKADVRKVIWTNDTPANVKYIFRNLNVSTYSPYLADTIVCRMAMELSWAVLAHRDKFADLSQVYRDSKAYNQLMDGQEQPTKVFLSTGLTDDVRHGG